MSGLVTSYESWPIALETYDVRAPGRLPAHRQIRVNHPRCPHPWSRAAVVSEVAVGEAVVGVVGVVGEAVVVAAEQDPVGEVGCPALGPGFGEVVGFGPGGWSVAAFGAAAIVAQHHRGALGPVEQAGFAAQVQHHRGSAEDGGDDPGPAGEPADLAG